MEKIWTLPACFAHFGVVPSHRHFSLSAISSNGKNRRGGDVGGRIRAAGRSNNLSIAIPANLQGQVATHQQSMDYQSQVGSQSL
jgi:hypothetical protein